MNAPAGQLGLHPGSRTPSSPEEVEQVLRQVPGMAFVPELAGCVFERGAIGPRAEAADLARLCDDDFVARVLAALASVERRADAENNGGLKFLAHALRHFLSVQRLAPGEHPLVVGLYLRAHARKAGTPDTLDPIALAMDAWMPPG